MACEGFARLLTQELSDATGQERADTAFVKSRVAEPEFEDKRIFATNIGFPEAGVEARLWRGLQDNVATASALFIDGFLAESFKMLRHCETFATKQKPAAWSEWRKKVRGVARAGSFARMGDLSKWLDEKATFLETEAAKKRAFDWKQWCRQEAAKPGAPAVHRHMRGTASWAEFLVDGTLGTCLLPQDDADERAAVWHKQWDIEQEEPLEWPNFTYEDASFIGMPSFDEFTLLVRTFKPKTAIGTCGFHPRHFELISEAAV